MNKYSIPKYRKQTGRSFDRAFVSLNNRRYYLGEYGTEESQQEYRRVLAEWTLNSHQVPRQMDDITIVELLVQFWRYAESYYCRPDGTPTTEISNYRQALRPLKLLYGNTLARDFGPKALKAIRQHMIDKGWARTNINKMIGRIKRIFRWATENEFLPSEVYHALQAVPGLKRGRTKAKETKPIKPVPQAHIDVIHPCVSKQVWALVQLQLFTGSRSGELVKLRPVDIDMTHPIWTYKPVEHKTAHYGYERTVYFGPRAQRITKPFLQDRLVDAYIFNPREAEAERRARMHANRKTPLSCGNRPGTNRKKKPKRMLREHYSRDTYRRAIRRACQKVGIPAWHPHQLRHNAATRLRAEFGIEAAQIILGHRRADVTQIYAEVSRAKALDIATKVG
ncbi:MAG: site-specific integrase [Planctomycetes bacterium]|nr:site-specific integrase [Planctomycetota bacterium]